LNASSAFGAFLDPVADKLMVATVLILNGLNPVPTGPLMGNTWLFPVLACSKFLTFTDNFQKKSFKVYEYLRLLRIIRLNY